jgi:hypothetical protein
MSDTDRAQILFDQLAQFMDTHIYPNEEEYTRQLNALPDRFTTVPLMEELKNEARWPAPSYWYQPLS